MEKSYQVEVPDDMPLLWFLRDVVGLTGTKFGCGITQWGVCTVHTDGHAVRSCVTRVGAIAERSITTIEGIGSTPRGRTLQQAWLVLQVPQCGYCQPGQIMSAAALLAISSHPTNSQIDAAMAGNICRCCTFERLLSRCNDVGLLAEEHDPLAGRMLVFSASLWPSGLDLLRVEPHSRDVASEAPGRPQAPSTQTEAVPD